MRNFYLEIVTRDRQVFTCESYTEAEAKAQQIEETYNAGHSHGEKTSVRAVDPNAEKACLYFGCGDESGHYLWTKNWGRGDYYNNGTPWKQLDGYLLGNAKEPDEVTGRVRSTCGTKEGRVWWAFVWWDRSVDRRGGSNSGFYVSGFLLDDRDAAFAYACEQWPDVVKRQACTLVLV